MLLDDRTSAVPLLASIRTIAVASRISDVPADVDRSPDGRAESGGRQHVSRSLGR
jgi:hypothetical protein